MAAGLLAAVITGCLRERDRLDVPRLALVITSSAVTANDSIRGYVYAVDATGIVFLQVTAQTGDSVASRRLNRISADSVQIDFALRVPADAQPGAVVSVFAIARDTQDFEVTHTDTLFVTGGAPPP